MKRILAYSAKKKRAKGPAEYSTLKPETSSDSPSVKSKGARLVSARVETYHMIPKGHKGKISQLGSWVTLKARSVKEPVKSVMFRRISPRFTS